MNTNNVIVLGATGLTGSKLVDQLSADKNVQQVYAIVRALSDELPSNVDQIVVDFDNLNPEDLPTNATTIFLCLGTTMAKAGSKEAFIKVDKDYTLSFAKMAFAKGCKRAVLISAMGADSSSSVFYSKIKGEIEQELAKIGFARVDIFQPALLIGDRNEGRFFESISQKLFGRWTQKISSILGDYTSIGADQLANHMKATLSHTDGGTFTHTYTTFNKLH
jgi:uncharacterized protein YbjT (DUF2867 family)